MDTFDNKIKNINDLIKSSKDKEDEIVLKTLFDMVCYDKPTIKENKNISELSNEDLFGKFFPYSFYYLTFKKYTIDLLQTIITIVAIK